MVMKRNGFLFTMSLTLSIVNALISQCESAHASMAMKYNTWELSPNGQTAAISSSIWGAQEESPHYRVWVVGLSQRKVETLIVIQNAYAPKYSPAGDTLGYVHAINRIAFPPGNSDTRISLLSLEDKSGKELTTGYADQQPAWSDDGSTIAFARILRNKPGMQVYVTDKMEGDGFTSPHGLGDTHSAIAGLAWRPTHDEIAYVATKLHLESYESGTGRTRTFDIILVDIAGNVRTITSSGDVGPKSVCWSPGGRYAAYVRETAYLVNKPGSGGNFAKLVMIQPDSKGYHEVVTASEIGCGPLRVGNLRWSPDGRQIVFDVLTLDEAAKTDIASVEWASGEFRWLTRDGKSKLPRWSSDGRTIMYVRADSQIWRVNADGTRNQKVYNLED